MTLKLKRPLRSSDSRNADLLGCLVEDIFSGFTGVAIERTLWHNGCIRYTIQPQKVDPKTGKVDDTTTIDSQDLKSVRKIVDPVPPDNRTVLEMGEEVSDPITKTKGKVYAMCLYLDGTIRYGFQSKLLPGQKDPVLHWQDSEFLVPKNKKRPAAKKKPKSGGPTMFETQHK